MSKKILIAYASGSGSTREVAEAIAAEIEGGELSTQVQHVSQVKTVATYSGVVLGSSIRIGRWLPDAIACVERIKDELADRPVAYFTTCLTMLDDTKESRETVLAYMQPLLNLTPRVKPIGLGLFAGSLDPARRAIMPGAGPQGDFRDWAAIRAWGQKIRSGFLAGQHAEQPEMAGMILSYTDMSYTDMPRADLEGAELHSSKLVETNLQAANLAWADLSQSQMQGANLFQANLIGSILTESVLQEAHMAEATLNGAILQHANLKRANLTMADLNWADLSGADLTEANLQRARLGWANLTNASLDGADLADARYNEHTIWPKGFDPEGAGCLNMGRGAM